MLTGNDLALAQSAVQMTITWWKDRPESDYGAEQMRRLDELNQKLDAILNRAYPNIEEPTFDGGDESVMIFNPEMTPAIHS